MTRTEKQTWWQHHIESWESGDQSQSHYCELHDLKLATFDYWRTRLLRQRLADEAETADAGGFVAVHPSSVAESNRGEAQAAIDYGSIRITLPVSCLTQALPLLQGLARSHG